MLIFRSAAMFPTEFTCSHSNQQSCITIPHTLGCPDQPANIAPHPPSKRHLQVLELFHKEISTHGGTFEYLTNTYGTKEKKTEFRDKLFKAVPMDPEVTYWKTTGLPTTSESDVDRSLPLKIHCTAFSWGAGTTLKTFPEIQTCDKLAERMLNEGFITAWEPLRMVEPKSIGRVHIPAAWVSMVLDEKSGTKIEVPENQLGAFALHHDRSAARTSTLLVLLSLFIEDEFDIERHCSLPCPECFSS